MNQQSPTLVVTGKVRISYCHLTQPYANQPGAEPKFSATLLIPKSDVATRQQIDRAIAAAVELGVKDRWNGMKPPHIPLPIHDGDGVRQSDGLPFSDECKGHWVMAASTKQRPEIVDINMQPIIDPTQVYSGMYARVSIRLFAYNISGKRGIGCGLNNVQKLEDGEPLGGRTSAADDFNGVPGAYPTPAPGYAPGYPAAPAAVPQHAYQAPGGHMPPQQYAAPAAPAYQPPQQYAPPPAPAYQPPVTAYSQAQPPGAYQAPGGYSQTPPGYPGGINMITGQPDPGPVLGMQ